MILYISGASEKVLMKVKSEVQTFLAAHGLTLSEEKTKITAISNGFNFLGFNVRRYNNSKTLVKPSKESIKDFLNKIRALIKSKPSVKASVLISQLNPVISGWANYYKHCVAQKAFAYVDSHIFRSLWRWAKKRHPNKSANWVREKYFRTRNQRQWVFSTTTITRSGVKEWQDIFIASSVPIRRHIKNSH
ncbi:reverse transcriptase [Legionella busanensis]|uniref:Reverse transcriptase n=2 Tax=Legionella busanensis TaxID=190655 RepID=A0A378K9N1_9GAMM|nr:reverse transcriptase [Legionella busanensis]